MVPSSEEHLGFSANSLNVAEMWSHDPSKSLSEGVHVVLFKRRDTIFVVPSSEEHLGISAASLNVAEMWCEADAMVN